MSRYIEFPSIPAKTLSAPLSSTGLTFQVSDILKWDGVTDLAATDFGTVAYAAFRNVTNTRIEFFKIDPGTIAASSITILARGLGYSANDYATTSAARQLAWNANETIVEFGSNPSQLYEQFVAKGNAGTLTEVLTFTTSKRPKMDVDGDTATAEEFVTYGQLNRTALGTTLTDRLALTSTAGETVAAGDAVYFKESDQRWWKTDADALATSENVMIGIAQGAGTAGAGITSGVLIQGFETHLTGLTAGSKYYLSSTAAALATTPGVLNRFVGWALSTTRLLVSPSQTGLEEQLEAGTAGEALTAGDMVYFKESDQKWWHTDADAAATAIGVAIGIAQVTANANAVVIVRLTGIDRSQTGLTAGTRYYLSGTAGAIRKNTATFTAAVDDTVTSASHGLSNGDSITVSNSGGALPTGLSVATRYYIISAATNTFKVSLTSGGAAVDITGVGSGTQTWIWDTLVSFPRLVGVAISTQEILMETVEHAQILATTQIYAADSVGTDAYAITLQPPAPCYYIGMEVNWTAGTPNTLGATLNISGLGAKAINKKYNVALETGDILTSQINKAVYDGVAFQLISSPAQLTIIKVGLATRAGDTATGSQAIAHTLGRMPKRIRLTAVKYIGNGGTYDKAAQSFGSFDGTTQVCVYNYLVSAASDASNPNGSSSFVVQIMDSSTAYQTATVTFDATNITLAWTKTSTPSNATINMMWEAEG